MAESVWCVSISVGRCVHECAPEYVCVCEPVCATGVLLEMSERRFKYENELCTFVMEGKQLCV